METDKSNKTFEKQRDAFVDRIFAASLGTFDIFAIYIGSKLGFYKALATASPLSPKQLADQTDTHERYAREWLEQQAVTGILTVEDETRSGGQRRYALPAAHGSDSGGLPHGKRRTL